MKKTILVILFVGITCSIFAQHRNHDKINAFKIAFITEKLDLTSKEAEKFWPIYNKFSKKERELRRNDFMTIRRQVENKGGIDNLSDIEASNILGDIIINEDKLHQIKQQLIIDLKPVISTKKILKLYRAEKEFNRKLLKRIREKKEMRRN